MIPAPALSRAGTAPCPHMTRAVWPDDARGEPAHLRLWATADAIVVKTAVANLDVRGRDMMRWAASHGLPVVVVEVLRSAAGFWDRMVAEGLVARWTPYDGFPSPLERSAMPFRPGIPA